MKRTLILLLFLAGQAVSAQQLFITAKSLTDGQCRSMAFDKKGKDDGNLMIIGPGQNPVDFSKEAEVTENFSDIDELFDLVQGKLMGGSKAGYVQGTTNYAFYKGRADGTTTTFEMIVVTPEDFEKFFEYGLFDMASKYFMRN